MRIVAFLILGGVLIPLKALPGKWLENPHALWKSTVSERKPTRTFYLTWERFHGFTILSWGIFNQSAVWKLKKHSLDGPLLPWGIIYDFRLQHLYVKDIWLSPIYKSRKAVTILRGFRITQSFPFIFQNQLHNIYDNHQSDSTAWNGLRYQLSKPSCCTHLLKVNCGRKRGYNCPFLFIYFKSDERLEPAERQLLGQCTLNVILGHNLTYASHMQKGRNCLTIPK